MNSILYKSFDKAVADAMETGDQVVVIECPCCRREFYTIKSRAVHERIVRSPDDYAIDLQKFSFEKLGEKCPYCGYSGMLSWSDFLNSGRRDAEAGGQCDLYYEGESSFADICRWNLNFKWGLDDD